MKGTVRKLVNQKGFGFIDSEGEEYFFHRSGVRGDFDDLQEGAEVYFSPQEGTKGLRAIEVSLSKEAELRDLLGTI